MNYGKDVYRTFDGHEYTFSGQCKYLLAKDAKNNWEVYVTMVGCAANKRFDQCQKVKVSVIVRTYFWNICNVRAFIFYLVQHFF